MNILQKAEHYHNQFTTTMRGKENIVVFKNESPELQESMYRAHNDRLPADWIFNKYHEILGAITDYNIDTLGELEDKRSEIIDNLVDIYTSDLTAWLDSNNNNVYYLSEAMEEGSADDGFSLLALAQYKAIDEVFSEVYDLLTK